jgi:hypothetical protein
LLDVASRAAALFESSKPEQKRLLINMVLSNLRLEGQELHYELRKPFDALVDLSKSKKWLGRKDSNL